MDRIEPAEQSGLAVWGLRPVRWAFRMLGDNAQTMAASLSPGELREAAEFLGLELPTGGTLKELFEQFAVAAERRRETFGDAVEEASLLHDNLQLLQDTLGLNQVESNIIMFRAMLRLHPGFEALAGKYIGLCSDFVFHRRLSVLFGTSAGEVTSALHNRGKLVSSGLVSVIRDIMGSLESRLRLITGFISALTKSAPCADELLASLLPREREAGLALSNYPHLEQEVRLLRDCLQSALSQRSVGVNLLLHGAAGAGKSELAAALASAVSAPLYECLGVDEDDGESLKPRARLRELVQAQRLVRIAGGGVILMDEAEDLFPTPWSDADKTPTKSAINECLERNPTPTIWISNRTRHIDEAFLRRFDLVIHVSQLPANAKCELLAKTLPAGSVSEREMRRYADQRHLSPAMLSRLAKVASIVSGGDISEIPGNLRVLSRHYLQTLGEPALSDSIASAALEFDPVLLNTEPSLESLFDTMGRTSLGARMLLHGPPGTGKTALGEAIAKRLDKTLLRHSASSLLSCWVGETEKNLREMFVEARNEDGVLLLDEADSFLGARERATARYAIMHTNELLAQMENFDGFLICTTNRLDDLDPAALRRFDLKVEFKPLRLEQRFVLLRQCCKYLGIRQRVEGEGGLRAIFERLYPLDSLTSGDAAAALRRLRLSGESPSLDALLDALRDECRYNPMVSRPIGFVH